MIRWVAAARRHTAARRQDDDERGAVLIIVAMVMVIIVGMLAIALDLGYAFVQNRRAQNASDFAAFAASQQLNSSSACNGTGSIPNMAQMVAMVQDVVTDNSPSIASNWSAQFLDAKGNALSGSTASFTSSSTNSSTYPPFGSCGVSVNAVPSWNTFFAGIFGVSRLTGHGAAKVTNTVSGTPYGIISLNPSGPHAVLGGGTGTFIVNGDVIVNTDVAQQPWTQDFFTPAWAYDDAIDAKGGANLAVYGTIESIGGPNHQYNGANLWPMDWCFGGAGNPASNGEVGSLPADQANDPAYTGVGSPSPLFNPACSQGNVSVKYNHIYPSMNPITDPLQSSGAPPNPFTAKPVCPGTSLQTFNGTTYSSGTLQPGEYTQPVKITGSVTFGDCSANGVPGYPGMFLFDQGLWIDPPANGIVSSGAAGVTIATKNPYPVAGNTVSGGATAGNGGPCLPAGTPVSGAPGGYTTEVDNNPTSHACSGATYNSSQEYGVRAYHDASPYSLDSGNYGTGTNFSLIVGGGTGSQINLTGPTFGGYGGGGNPGLVFYQSSGTQANYGFDAEPGDAAAVNITGVIYNGSLAANPTWDFWDNGIPFYAGGTLQAGFGAGWTGSTGPMPSSGSVKITGTAIVDDFNTDGGYSGVAGTTITIYGQPYTLPGNSKASFLG